MLFLTSGSLGSQSSWVVDVGRALLYASTTGDTKGKLITAGMFEGRAPHREWITSASGAVVSAQREYYLAPTPTDTDFTVLGICNDHKSNNTEVHWVGSEEAASRLALPNWLAGMDGTKICAFDSSSSVAVLHVSSPLYCCEGLSTSSSFTKGHPDLNRAIPCNMSAPEWLPRFEAIRSAHLEDVPPAAKKRANREVSSSKDNSAVTAAVDLTYGELATEGVLKLASLLEWNVSDVIVDVGSGEVLLSRNICYQGSHVPG